MNERPSVRFKAFGKTDVGRVRSGNEDAFLMADLSTNTKVDEPSLADWAVGHRGILVAVSDGMGGAKAGEVASALSLEALLEGFCSEDGPTSARDDAERLRHVVERASRKVREAARRPERQGMGATLTAVLFRDACAYIAEVGDSRAYLIRTGRICQVTRDQSYVQLLVEAGLLTPQQAEESPQKNIVLQVMGQKEDVLVEVGELTLLQGDRFLLCSDGLSNSIHDDEILKLASPPASLEEACAALVDHANAAGGLDNITVVLVELTGDLARPSVTEGCENTVETVQAFTH
jgi:PPM family protein phosphatase